ELVLGVFLQDPFSGFAAERIVQIEFDVGFSLNVRLVKVEILNVRELVEIAGSADVSQEVRGHRVENVFSDWFDIDLHTRQPEIFFGKLRERREIEVLSISERDQCVVP